MEVLSNLLAPVAAARVTSAVAGSVLDAGGDFVSHLQRQWSPAETAGAAQDSPATGDSPEDQEPAQLLARIREHLDQLFANRPAPPEPLELEVSPLGHIHVLNDGLPAAQLEAELDSDAALRQLFQRWSSVSGSQRLTVNLDAASRVES
jgi:hypothetical protein